MNGSVHFNELRITPDGRHMIIDVSIIKDDYLTDVYLDSICIDDEDTFSTSGPSSKMIYQYEFDYDSKLKHARIVVDKISDKIVDSTGNCLSKGEGIPIGNKLYFVYVNIKGTPSDDAPCGADTVYTMKTVMNLLPLYRKAIKMIGEVKQSCKIPDHYADFFLRMQFLKMLFNTGNYSTAITFFKNYIKDNPVSSYSPNCNCSK